MLLLLSLFSFWLPTIAEARDCLRQFRDEGPRKTRIKKMEHSPTRIHVKPLCSPALISLACENFLRFRSASLEHNATSAERVLLARVQRYE